MSTSLRRKAARSVLVCAMAFSILTTAAPLVAAAPGKPAAARAVARRVSTQPYVEGELIVRFKEGAGELVKYTAHATLGSRVQRSFRLVPGLQAVRLSRGRSVDAAIRSYRAMPGVLYAQPNYIKHALSVPDDADFATLWGLHNTGQTGGIADADIDAPEAWDITTGSSEVVVAVVDSGIDYAHPDLAANVWTNPGEIPDNDVDDDGNGYVDDVHGWDAVNDDGDPIDDQGHGTHCAGTIGAVGNDGVGITGVNQIASVMAIKVLDAAGYASTADIVEGYEYLAQSPAGFSSNSWGGWYEVDVAERDAIAAVDKLFVFAAGNENSDIDLPNGATQQYAYPASYDLPNILSVGATNASDQRAPFSNWGAANVDVFAPGTDILSTQPLPRRLAIAPGSTVNPLFADNLTTLAGWQTSDHMIKPWERVTDVYTSAPSSAAHLGYQDDEAAYLDQAAVVDLSSADYPGMRFQWSYDTEPGWDFAEIWASDESDAQWYFMGAVSGDSGGFVQQYVDLGRFAGENDIRISFGIWADSSNDSDQGYQGVWVDDVEIFDLDSAVPGASPWAVEAIGDWANAYDSWSGTSMAAPHAAGVAALALSRNAGLDTSDLKRIVMDTVDVKVQLAGLCMSGGRVNAASAVAAAVPIANANAFTAQEDGVLLVPAGTGVLANDSYFDALALTAVLATDTAHGELLLDADGSFSYTPDANFNGTDAFAYRASDGGLLSDVATVTIAVAPVNDAPLALADDYVIGEDGTLAVPPGAGVLANDSDIDSGALSAVLSTATAHGQLLLNSDGSVSYTPDTDFNGTDAFTYRASDGATLSVPATVTITVTPVNDAPVAIAEDYVAQEDGWLQVSAGIGVLTNDSDIEDDALAAVLATETAHGEVLLNADGSFGYTPDADFNGTDEFTYRASDGATLSAPATVTITVTPLDEPPVIALAGTTRFDTAVAISQASYPHGLSATGERTVVIATGRNWPDALGGSALAGVLDGPILLVDTTGVPSSVVDEIERLGAERAIILGGTNAIGVQVEQALAAQFESVDAVRRIAGGTRYETADKIAAEVIAAQPAYDGVAFVATGGKFPDALGAAPLAAAQGWPLFLSHPVTGLSAATKAAMAPVERVLVLGGTSAVSSRDYAFLDGASGGAIERLDGVDRYATAVRVATWGVEQGHLGWNRVAIATGANFPDALAGGVLQGSVGSVMLLTRPTALDSYTAAALSANKAGIATVTYFGGTGVLPPALRDQVEALLQP